MTKDELKAGTEYAFREKRVLNCPLQRIRLIESVQGKWKAEWIDPNPSLIDYIVPKRIVALWEDHKDFLRDENSMAQLTEYVRSSGYRTEDPVHQAVEAALGSTGEDVFYHKGTLSSSSQCLNRISARAGFVKHELKPPAYIDRKGDVHLPFDQALELAQSFCKTGPLSVLTEVESTERQWSSEASRPGEEYIIPLLNSYRAAWVLLRQWCHNDAFTAAREKEISILVRLLWDAIYALQKAGADEEAARLRHMLEHG